MKSPTVLPSLLLFGPQTQLPSLEVLAELREALLQSPQLAILRQGVADLPSLWSRLTRFDEDLTRVPGARYLDDLNKWIDDGGDFPHHQSRAPNVFALPVTVLLQIAQYIRYLEQIPVQDAHLHVLRGLEPGGVQGFCVGFLTAIAVGSSTTEEEIALNGVSSLLLAVVAGAYVDLDGSFSDSPEETRCFALRWKSSEFRQADVEDLILQHPGAYISSINDDACVTVTAPVEQISTIIADFHALGMRTKLVHVQGRFHSDVHSPAVEKILKFLEYWNDPAFPKFLDTDISHAQASLRSTTDGQVITAGSITRIALESILSKQANWYQTVKSAVDELPSSRKNAVFVGFGDHIPASLLQTPDFLVQSLSKTETSNTQLPIPDSPTPEFPPNSIAIVGMAGRFPGADNLDELWQLLLAGKSTVEPAPDRINLSALNTGDSETKWWGNFLRNPESFDHRFFKKSSREALTWDPQQRVLFEVVYEALESSGYFGPSSREGISDYGCYIGTAIGNYCDNVSCHPPTAYATVGTARCFCSGTVSHYFGWTGPALSIDTACSSSHVAIDTACKAIIAGTCSRAIAGGTNVFTSPFEYKNLNAAGFLSPTGQCKPFDQGADGYCRGEGVGVVVLKLLTSAIEEGDNILGVIVGSATNQNENHSHITVPHAGSQVKLYESVMKQAGVMPGSVSYVEAHGTGTGVGDPIEVTGLRDGFGSPSRKELLHFSSMKGNIGHTEGTAGVAGLIKVLLMLQHGKIPPQASFSVVNSNIPSFGEYRMDIPRHVLPWESPVRIACVNSYGAAGSNAAILVRQKPNVPSGLSTSIPLSHYPLYVSAASASSLSMYCSKLLGYVRGSRSQRSSESWLSDFLFNLADRTNHSLPFVLSTSVGSIAELETKLTATASDSTTLKTTITGDPKPIVLVFSGQESNFIGISEDIYQSSAIFRQHLDQCNDLLVSFNLESLYPAIFQRSPISNVVTLHSALFAVQYATAKAWLDCGIQVAAVVGHSFGQLTALCISGVLSLKDALKLVTGRASIMLNHWGPERGSMMWLQASREKVQQILDSVNGQNPGDDIEIACYNGPSSHVAVGSAIAIQTLGAFIADDPTLRDSVRTKTLLVTHGFHSKFTEPLLPRLAELARSLTWNRPIIQLEACDATQRSTDPDFSMVAEHMRNPVFFEDAVQRLSRQYPQCTFLEAGHGSSVMKLVQGCVAGNNDNLFLPLQLTKSNNSSSLVDSTLSLWKSGHRAQYWPFHRCQRGQYQHMILPPYQFEKTDLWLPFIGRTGPAALVDTVPEVKEHKLLSFVGFKDASKKEAIFRIDPESERYQWLLKGHVMAGQSLVPASLSFELVACAALSLLSDVDSEAYVPCVENLHMTAPLGLNINKDITLTLSHLEGRHQEWAFRISTQTKGSEPFHHTSGTVFLQKKNDSKANRKFNRFQTLIGSQRCIDILDNPAAEKMQGNHIYRVFSHIVSYAEQFRGIKTIASVGLEAAGRVSVSVDADAPPHQRLCNTPSIEAFMGFAGFLVNYFNNPSFDDVLICNLIERVEIGGIFDPDAKDWLVYSTMTEIVDGKAFADAYVFEAKSKKLVMVALGCHFSKISQSLLARVLKGVNKAGDVEQPSTKTIIQVSDAPMPTEASETATPKPQKKSSSVRSQVFQVIHNITDVPMEDLKDESTFDDLGIDSLMATEVLNDLRAALGISVDLSAFLFFEDLREICTYLDEKLGNEPEAASDSPMSSSNNTSTTSEEARPVYTPSSSPGSPQSSPPPGPAEAPPVPTLVSVTKSFESMRYDFDQVATETKATSFWSEVYPDQARLVLAYVVEAFANLGCDLNSLQAGAKVPKIQFLDRHEKLVRQFYHILEDSQLVTATDGGFCRTSTPVDTTSSESIFQEILPRHPESAMVHQLIKVIGSRLAACLTGEADGLQLLFGTKTNKQILEDLYENWPIPRTPNLLLGDFLMKAFSNSSGRGPFRILEIGAGTGGTTRHLVNHLRGHGIPFEYTFSDVGASLVAAAKKYFQGQEGMKFEVLDIEKEPSEHHHGAYHVVIAANCIHATRNLDGPLSHLRKMLRDDGVLALVEMTKNIFWLDIVYGLIDGWFTSNDGRNHPIVDEKHWERRMKDAGFKEVAWTDGDTLESKTIRIIAGFPAASPEAECTSKEVKKAQPQVSVETVVYKRVGNTDIHADIYYPSSSAPPSSKLPIALMIHGGSHIIFSRKDIRPPQTRLLLEKGFLPISLDHRMCPEISLSQGPMVDICDALSWARNELPHAKLRRSDVEVDGERVVVVGWSSGGQLAMSLAWTAPQRGLKPPSAILAFYCPTDYEDDWWKHPITPEGAKDTGEDYDLFEAIQDEPVTNYGAIGAWAPMTDPRIRSDPRARLVLHINWKAQTIPLIIGGLPSKSKILSSSSNPRDYYNLPQPSSDKVIPCSPIAQIRNGNYKTPTFFVHGTNDELIPWQQTKRTFEELKGKGVQTELVLVKGAPHVCDLSSEAESEGWKAVVRGYEFLYSFV
ncbi:related to polyketide synthase [Phialocephala subalpina]|uniref:Related to polyketide synthase n=1 Tax=Phialocephala subalpina TaxID=576137 RepID=A0A1L7WIH3_9HELO|nr:related to polyketide synthase [Phialocephala subalpina]